MPESGKTMNMLQRNLTDFRKHIIFKLLLFTSMITFSSENVFAQPSWGYSVDWQLNGNTIALVEDGYFSLWDAQTNSAIPTNGHSLLSSVNFTQWNNNGNLIAIAHISNEVSVWEFTNGRLAEMPLTIFNDFSDDTNLHSMSWSKDDQWLAISSGETLGFALQILETTTYQPILRAGQGMVSKIEWHPVLNNLLAIATGLGIYVIDMNTYTADFPINVRHFSEFLLTTQLINSNNNSMFSLAWSPNGEYIAMGDYQGIVYIYSMHTKEEIWRLVNDNFPVEIPNIYYVNDIHWGEITNDIVASVYNGAVNVWDIEQQQIVMSYENTNSLHGISLSTYGVQLVLSQHLQTYVPEIVVPNASKEELEMMIQICNLDISAETLLIPDQLDTQLYVEQPISPCVADLIAVAEAIQSQ